MATSPQKPATYIPNLRAFYEQTPDLLLDHVSRIQDAQRQYKAKNSEWSTNSGASYSGRMIRCVDKLSESADPETLLNHLNDLFTIFQEWQEYYYYRQPVTALSIKNGFTPSYSPFILSILECREALAKVDDPAAEVDDLGWLA